MTAYRARMVGRTVLWGVVVATLVGALLAALTQSFARAEDNGVPGAPVLAMSAGLSVAELLSAPLFPDLEVPDVPLPKPAAATTPADHCGDRDWWNARQAGDPSDYVAACGEWPSWIPGGEAEPVSGDVSGDGPGAAPYTGPTDGPWSPEYGYYEGRTDGPKNSNGELCMQGRDNNDPNC